MVPMMTAMDLHTSFRPVQLQLLYRTLIYGSFKKLSLLSFYDLKRFERNFSLALATAGFFLLG